MHELSISRSIVAVVAEAARGRRVLAVTLEVGKLSGVLSDAVAFCFPLAAQGTVVEGAELRILAIEGRARCTSCGSEFAIEALAAPCACGCRRLVRLAGEELNIKSMEVEEEVRECASTAAVQAGPPPP